MRIRSRPLRWLLTALVWLVGRGRRARRGEAGRAGVPPEPVELEHGPHRRAENVVLALLGGTVLAAGGFIAFYVVLPDTQLLGLTLGAALLLLGAAAIAAGKRVVPQETAVEERSGHAEREEREEAQGVVRESGEGISRRRLLVGAAGAAGASVGVAALFPVASLGPRVGETIYRTAWRGGRRVVDERDELIRAEQVTQNTLLTGFPEGASKDELGASIIIVRVEPSRLELPPGREAGAPEGIVAYSKICTHAACAVSMYQAPLYEPSAPPSALVCPCHYSTFDPALGGKVIFGPAGRDLPRLPLAIAPDRTLTAIGDFLDPVGPSYGGIRLRDD